MSAEVKASALRELLEVEDERGADDPTLTALCQAFQQRYGPALLGIWLYGSYLRGTRDTLIDFYLILDDTTPRPEPRWQQRLEALLPPNVYYRPAAPAAKTARSKYATITAPVLSRALAADHSYFWVRLAQPCRLLYSRDAAARTQLFALREQAVRRCLGEARALSQSSASLSGQALFRALFRRSYDAELRSEPPERADLIAESEGDYFNALSRAAPPGDAPAVLAPQQLERRWRRRARRGKALSVLRLVKASFTFSGGLEYLLWKVERHSGVALEASPLQLRYPLLFAWPLVWRAYRAGGFR